MRRDKAFLGAIREKPDDDMPRLVYADWLEEQGDGVRAEFIRIQIELARHGQPAARRRELKARERELLARHKMAWGGGLLSEVGKWCYRRGFVEAVRTDRERFAWHADELFRLHPVRHLRFTCVGDFGREPGLREFARWLAKWPPLKRVESLGFWGDSAGGDAAITRAELAVLLASRHLTRLRTLDITDNVDMDRAGQDLAAARVLARLTGLTLHLIDPNVVADLAASRFVPRLRRLALPWNDLGDEALGRLADWPAVADLAWLDLRHNSSIGPAGAEALAASPYLRRLRRLDLSQQLSQSAIGDRGLEALVGAGKLDAVRRLALEDNNIGPDGARALAGLHRLRRLNLRGNFRIGPEGMRALANSANLAGLRRLNVGITGLGDRGARALARSAHLRGLTELTAYANQIGDAGARALAGSPVLARVRVLRLGGNHTLSDAGARALAESRYLDRVTCLELPSTGIGQEGRRLLRERFGVRVHFDSDPNQRRRF
jgi:uncharacterized protein (TIGR02996 family)